MVVAGSWKSGRGLLTSSCKNVTPKSFTENRSRSDGWSLKVGYTNGQISIWWWFSGNAAQRSKSIMKKNQVIGHFVNQVLPKSWALSLIRILSPVWSAAILEDNRETKKKRDRMWHLILTQTLKQQNNRKRPWLNSGNPHRPLQAAALHKRLWDASLHIFVSVWWRSDSLWKSAVSKWQCGQNSNKMFRC